MTCIWLWLSNAGASLPTDTSEGVRRHSCAGAAQTCIHGMRQSRLHIPPATKTSGGRLSVLPTIKHLPTRPHLTKYAYRRGACTGSLMCLVWWLFSRAGISCALNVAAFQATNSRQLFRKFLNTTRAMRHSGPVHSTLKTNSGVLCLFPDVMFSAACDFDYIPSDARLSILSCENCDFRLIPSIDVGLMIFWRTRTAAYHILDHLHSGK